MTQRVTICLFLTLLVASIDAATADRETGAMVFSTLLGATGNDQVWALALDQDGTVYVAGKTEAADFPVTAGAYQSVHGGGLNDVFVAKVAADGTSVLWATYLGGNNEDDARDIAVASDGVWLVGSTRSPDFPTTAGAFDTSHNGGYYPTDGFVAKLSLDGSTLLYGSYLGGGSTDFANAVVLDGGLLRVAGSTHSSDFPTTAGAFDATYNPPDPNGESDVFYVTLDPALSGAAARLYGTYLGGGGDDSGEEMVLDGAGRVVITGSTTSADFPTTDDAHDQTHNGGSDVFLAILDPTGGGTSDLVAGTFLGGSDWDYGYGLWVEPAGTILVGAETFSSDFPTTAGAYERSHAGEKDLAVARLDAAAGDLRFSTFVGGSEVDYLKALTLDQGGNVVAVANTKSSDFPTTADAADPSLGGSLDAALITLSPDGARLLYSSHFGGSYWTTAYGLELTASGELTIAGYSQSSDFPTTPGAYQQEVGGGDCSPYPRCYDGFVTRVLLPPIFVDGFETGGSGGWDHANP